MRNPFKSVSLRTRVLVAMLVIGLLPVAVVFTASHFIMRRVLEEGTYGVMQALVGEVSREVAHVMTRAQADMRALTRNPVLANPVAGTEDQLGEMRKARDLYELFADITLYYTNGIVALSTTYNYWDNLRYTDWFDRALKGDLVVAPPARILGIDGLYVSLYAALPDEQDNPRYVLGARVPFQRVQEIVNRARPSRNGFMALLDGYGNALSYPDSKGLLRKVLGEKNSGWWMANPRGVYPDESGKKFLYHAESVPVPLSGLGRPWILIALIPYSDAVALLGEQRRILFAAALLTLIAVYGIGVYFSAVLSRSLVAAAKAAQRASRGDTNASIPISGPRELRLLAQTFNHMLEEVRQHRERLESLVAQRTARLTESQQKLEEITAHLRAAYESMMDGVLMLEWPSGKVMAANQRFAELFELPVAEKISGKTFRDLAGDIRNRLAEKREDMFRWDYFSRHPVEVGVEEWELVRPGRKVLSTYTAPAVGSNGRVFARLWVFRDMTQQRQLEDELRQSQKMEAVGRLAGGIAHDFNNLLTGILGNLSMVEMDQASAPLRGELIAGAREAAVRASELVRQLLGFSRRSRLQLKSCNVNRVVQEVHELLRHSMDPKVELHLQLEKDLWTVSADPTPLLQVLMNLCVNAMDAMPSGGRLAIATQNVHVDAEEARQWMDGREGDCVRMSVADCGQGMSQEVQSHLFEPFYTTKEPGKGTGLGLAMSYGIVRQHGGWIACYSELNRGTTFSIYLPRAYAVEESPERPQAEAPVKGGKESVLVVDDEPAVRAVMSSILRRYGYAVLLAAHGEEALHLLKEKPDCADLVLLDLTMPKLSGRDTLRMIREIKPKLPVVISSGYPIDLDSFEQETKLRPDGFVQKPYEAKVLAQTVRAVLDGRGSGLG